jgi:hypothetical protein
MCINISYIISSTPPSWHAQATEDTTVEQDADNDDDTGIGRRLTV